VTCDRERFPIVLRRSSSAPDTAHPNHRLHATIKQVDGEFQSRGATTSRRACYPRRGNGFVPCWSTGRLAEALSSRSEAIAVAATTAAHGGEDLW